MNNKIVIDLDNTICFPNLKYNDTHRRYSMAEPNYEVIKQMKLLSSKGYEFIIFTSRRMLTHNGNINKIKEDVELITINWLKKYKVPYLYIQWGKPYGIYYVDDKAMTISEFKKFNK